MKKYTAFAGMLAFVSAIPVLMAASPAIAGNSSVEATLQSYGDLSVFYQALLNTGVINELNENEHYTIFAPTNAAFAQIGRDKYPCFYAVECRPQIAAMLRNHIIVGRYDLPELTSYGYGIKADGGKRVHVEEAYVNDYTVENQKILSKSDAAGNYIYRTDGVLTNPQELTQFTNMSYASDAYTSGLVTQKTVTRKTSYAPVDHNYPTGIMLPADQNEGSQTTTVIQTYTTQQ